MTEPFIPFIRKVGLLLMVTPAGLYFVALAFYRGNLELINPFLWSICLMTGTYLMSLRTKKENEDELNRKRARYSRMVRKFGSKKVRFTFKASVVAILALFSIALLSILYDSMPVFWCVVFLIAVSLVLAVLTDNPDSSVLSEEPHQVGD